MHAKSIIVKPRPTISETITKLDNWLLSESVCNKNGAVAGIIKNNQVSYWYNEIAGYYLSYLAHLHSFKKVDPSLLNELSFRVSKRLHQQWINQSWLTRDHHKPTQDWRNNRHFSFDLAMVLRGLADANSSTLQLAWDGREIAEFLQNFISKDQEFLAAKISCESAVFYNSWSLKTGAYQWKTLSGLLRHSKIFGLDILNQQIHYLSTQLHLYSICSDHWQLPPHPTLYALEGKDDLQLLSKNFHNLNEIKSLEYVNKNDIELWRIDVIAQKLRLMVSRKYTNKKCRILAHYLIDSISDNGTIGFRPYNNEIENVWCAIFARQALSDLNQSYSNINSKISKYI